MILSGSVSFRLWLQQLAANSGQWAAVACRAPAIRGNLMPPPPTYKWLPSYPKMFFPNDDDATTPKTYTEPKCQRVTHIIGSAMESILM